MPEDLWLVVKRRQEHQSATIGERVLRGLLGQVKVEADEWEIRFYNEQGRIEAALLKCIGADARNCGSGGRI